MTNHVAKINTPTSTPSNPAAIVRPEGKDWVVIYQVTGNLAVEPGRANAVICPEKVKDQE